MSIKRQAFGSWFLWTSLLLLLLGAVVLAGGSLSPSRAATVERTGAAAAGLGVLEASPVRVANTDVMTYTAYMPVLFSDFTYATLAVTKTAFPTQVLPEPGQVVTYTVTIRNQGDTAGTLRTVQDTLPTGFTFLGMDPSSDVVANPVGTTGLITWSGSWSMVPEQEMRFVYRVSASQAAGTYANSVQITADQAFVPGQPATASVAVQPAVLMQEDFNSGLDQWTAFLNYHRLEEGQWYWGSTDGVGGSGGLTHDCCSGPTGKVAGDALMMYLQPGAENWTNYRAETKMYLTGGVTNAGDPEPNSGDPVGFWIRGQYQASEYDSQWVSGYYVVLCGKSDGPTHWIRISKMQEPGDCDACLKPERMYNFNNPLVKYTGPEMPGSFEHYRWYKLVAEVRGANIKVYLDDELIGDWTDPTLPYLSGSVGFKAHETKTVTFDDVIVTPLQ